MESDDLVYRKLQKHLDRMPVGFPESLSGTDIKLLKDMFTIDEAEIALELSMLPESAERIFPRLKNRFSNAKELEVKLDDMMEKGLILGGKLLSKDDKKKLYSNAQFAVGMYEFHIDRMTERLANNFLDYFQNSFIKEAFKDTKGPGQMHTIPIGKSIIRENYTETYENVKEILKTTTGPIVLNDCVCRITHDIAGDKCKLSDLRETCIALKSVAQYCIDAGRGRLVSKEEALALIDKFEEVGFVIQPENNKNPEFICCCCGCCCAVLNMAKQFPKPAEKYSSNYYASVDTEKCAGCGTCTTRCRMDAISLKNEKAVVNLDRCIGCGLCTSTCKTGAVALNKKEKTTVPPANHVALYQEIFMKKVGPFAAVKTMIKYKLGMKV